MYDYEFSVLLQKGNKNVVCGVLLFSFIKFQIVLFYWYILLKSCFDNCSMKLIKNNNILISCIDLIVKNIYYFNCDLDSNCINCIVVRILSSSHNL